MSAFGDALKLRTKQFGLRVARMVNALPHSTTSKVLGAQVLRSAMSVGANYREAHRGRSEAATEADDVNASAHQRKSGLLILTS